MTDNAARSEASGLIILESPFAGDNELQNVAYARAALLDSLRRGENPIASHLLYTQVLDDKVPAEREQGIRAGLAWRRMAGSAAFYTDLGWSRGMNYARNLYLEECIPFEERTVRIPEPVEYRELELQYTFRALGPEDRRLLLWIAQRLAFGGGA